MLVNFVFLIVSVFISLTQPNTVLAQETSNSTASEAAVPATPQPTPATQPINLTVSPISLNIVTDPGASTNATIKIRNNGSVTENLHLSLATFTANTAGDTPVITDFKADDDSQNWLQFSEDTFTVKPGEWKTLQVTFSPPSSAALGYYYAILVERQQEADVEGGSTAVTGVPAILVLTEVSSPLAKKELQLVSFSSSKRLYEFLPAEFQLSIKNTGNIQTAPSGDIFIDSQDKHDLGIVPINPARGMILPGSTRTYTVHWDQGFPKYIFEKDELGNVKMKLDWDFSQANKFRIGKYEATALFVYDNGQRDIPTEATLSFWVMPWRIMLAALAVIALVTTGIILPITMITKRLRSNRKKS